MTTYELVIEALNNAYENGDREKIESMSDHDLANDLWLCAGGLVEEKIHDVYDAVVKYRSEIERDNVVLH